MQNWRSILLSCEPMRNLFAMISLTVALGLLSVSAHSEPLPISVGWIGPITGSLAKWGSYEAAQLAVEEVNNSGGIKGRKLRVIFEDGRGQGKSAAAAAAKLVHVDKVNYLLAGHCSPESLAIAPIVQRSNVVMLAAVSSSPLLTEAGDNVFRVTATSTKGTEAVFSYATATRGMKSFAVLYEESDYPRPQAERFRNLAESQNIPITAYEAVLPTETDFRTLLNRIQRSKPEGLYIATLSPDTAALIMKQIRELHINIPVFGNENMGHAIDSSGESKSVFNGIIFASSSYDFDEPVTKSFRQQYLARYHVTALPYGSYTAESYDAIKLLSSILEVCGDSVSAVKSCLYNVKDFSGASGRFSIDKNGDAIREYEMHTIEDGRIVSLREQKR